jgi:hypothetical protein
MALLQSGVDIAVIAVAERHCWNWEFVRDWLATRRVAGAALGT